MWTPPSITRPTTPYTLPPDYGQSDDCEQQPVPRVTYPAGEELPAAEWRVNDRLTIRFDPPVSFGQDPRVLPGVGECDRQRGLYVLERWFVADNAGFAGLAVQAHPGVESPLLSRTEFSDSVVTPTLTWYLWNGETVRQTGKPPNMGLAVLGDYLFMVHGTPEAMRAIIDNLTIETT